MALGYRILLIEDEASIADMYAAVLRMHGHEVRIEPDGAAGLQAAAVADFDLVLLDIRMPRMDGVEVLTELMAGQRTKTWPIVMLTNYDDPELRQRTRELGARDYVIKSQLIPALLATRVNLWVRSR
jgi:DNA-binding response OmpR family regulator